MAGVWTCDFLKLKSLSAKKTNPEVEVYLALWLFLHLPVLPQEGLSWQGNLCWQLHSRVMHYVENVLSLSLLGCVIGTGLMKLLGDTTLQIFDTWLLLIRILLKLHLFTLQFFSVTFIRRTSLILIDSSSRCCFVQHYTVFCGTCPVQQPFFVLQLFDYS